MSERETFTTDRHGFNVLTANANVSARAVSLSVGAYILLTADEATALGLWLSNAAQDVRTGFPFREAEQAGGNE